MKQKMFLLPILILAFFLRVVNLDKVPAGFFCDEASIGYNAYSLLKTGRDEYGRSWPLFFKAFGEYKNPIQIYSTIPFVALFGLSEFAVRLVSAVYGTLTVLAVYLLVKEILVVTQLAGVSKIKTSSCEVHQGGLLQSSCGDNKINFLTPKSFTPNSSNLEPAIAALLLSISPWHIHFSRVGFELMPFVFFTTLGTWLFLRSFKVGNQLSSPCHPELVSGSLNLSILSFVLALYSYSPARIFIPLFLIGLIIIFRKSLNLKTLFIGGLVLFLLALPLLFHIKSGQGLSRWHQVSVFKEKTFSQAVKQIKDNYSAHFSLDFLFKKGDAGMNFITRHSVKELGELYWFQLPLIFLGIWGLLLRSIGHAEFSSASDKKSRGEILKQVQDDAKIWADRRRIFLLLIWWLALYPLGSALSIDATPQATRSIIGVVPFQILSAIGFSYLLAGLSYVLDFFLSLNSSFKKSHKNTYDRRRFCEANFKILLVFLLVLLLLFSTGLVGAEFVRYLHLYFHQYPKYSSDYWGWQWGFREVMEDFSKRKGYDELLITHRFNRGETLLKFYQVTIPCPKCKIAPNPIALNPAKHQFFAVRKEGLKELEAQGAEFKIKKNLYYPNGDPAFFLTEVKNTQGVNRIQP